MAAPSTPAHSRRWLSGLNFFLADVRDGLGPFLGVLLVGYGWRADDIGYVMAAGGIAGMLATLPVGAWIDASRHKRLLLAGGVLVLVAATVAMGTAPSFRVALASQVAAGIAAALIGPALMGITLGIVGQKGLASQLGLNEAWSHAGNVAAAALAGLAGYRWGLPAVFVLMVLMGLASLFCVWRIQPRDIDHDQARGGASEPGTQVEAPRPSPGPLRTLMASRPLCLLAATMLLFHLANAAMLPLFTQAIVARGQADPSAFTASAIVVAQLVMIPVALLAGRHAARHGFWSLIMIALWSLPLRGVIASGWASPWALVPVQVLDGVGAGLLGVALPGLVARILQGTGHVNAGLGAVMAIQGIGAALSPALAGWVVHRHGYGAGFVTLAIIAAIALLICRIGLPSCRQADAWAGATTTGGT